MSKLRRAAFGAVVSTLSSLLCACSAIRYDNSLPSKNFDSRVLFIVIHYTAGDFDRSVRLLTGAEKRNPSADVSAHYLVGEQPARVYQLVDERDRAWHAGKSYWMGNANLNSSSIGIEIVNKGMVIGPDGAPYFVPYNPKQIELVIDLVHDIAARHHIRPDRILGHSDIQPQHKQDPGPEFPWHRLFDEGLIPWPDEDAVRSKQALYAAQLPSPAWFQDKLGKLGFDFSAGISGMLDEQTRNVVEAFQMKYRPTKFDGVLDAETAALLDVVTSPGGLLIKQRDGATVAFVP